MCTDFNISVSERFLASARDFPLALFQECTVAIGSDPVLTGYIDNYLPEVEADRHAVRVTGAQQDRGHHRLQLDIAGGSSPATKAGCDRARDRHPVQDRRCCANRCLRGDPRRHDCTCGRQRGGRIKRPPSMSVCTGISASPATASPFSAKSSSSPSSADAAPASSPARHLASSTPATWCHAPSVAPGPCNG